MYAWFGENSDLMTHSVGQKLPNAWGLYDMHGNTMEWCYDWWAGYTGGIAVDRQGPGPESDTYPVMRGGQCNFYARYCRLATRNTFIMGPGEGFIGFRVILVPGHL